MRRTWRPQFRLIGWRTLKRPPGDRWRPVSGTRSFALISQCWMMRPSEHSRPPRITGVGARSTCQLGWDMGAFEYRQAQEIRDCFQRHGIRYLFLGKSGAILLGFPDTTQDADLFVEKTPQNCGALVVALRELGFGLNDAQAGEIARGKDFIQ